MLKKKTQKLFGKTKETSENVQNTFLALFGRVTKAQEQEAIDISMIKQMEQQIEKQQKLILEQQQLLSMQQQQSQQTTMNFIARASMSGGNDANNNPTSQSSSGALANTPYSSFSTTDSSSSSSMEFAPSISVRTLIERFLKKHEPNLPNREGKLLELLHWTAQYGISNLNSMLQVRYGENLYAFLPKDHHIALSTSPLSSSSSSPTPGSSVHNATHVRPPVLTSQLDKLTRQLQGYFRTHDPEKGNMQAARVVAEHYAHIGIWEINHDLERDYGESLDDFTARMDNLYRGLLTKFYEKHDKSRLGGHGFESIVTWAINNGMDAVNEKLRDKYNDVLETPVHPKVAEVKERLVSSSSSSPLSIVQVRAPSVKQDVSRAISKAKMSEEEQKRAILHAQIQVFLEAHDAVSAKNEVFIRELVDWAYNHSEEQFDQILMETYGESLESCGLRWDAAELVNNKGGLSKLESDLQSLV